VSKKFGLDKPILQHPATYGNRCRRIVALEKVAGSSPVGHPTICRQNVRAGSYPGPLLLQPYCNPLAERFVQPFYSVAAYALQEVRVAVHRLRDREECPSSDCTIFGCLPLLNSSVAKVWRRLWKVKP
jgi:hypothetical protein